MDEPQDVRRRVAELGLVAHPEGGWFRELFRSEARVRAADGRERTAMTAIHFLLAPGRHSCWHDVRSDEQWTFVEGAPLELFLLAPDARAARRVVLGPGAGALSTAVVPAGTWQAARAGRAHALVVCTVAPGFEYDDFRLLRDVAGARERIERLAPELAELL